MKRTASARKSSKSRTSSPKLRGLSPPRNGSYVVCICNDGYQASLELRKLYRTLPDDQASRHKMIRIVDESEEDYLYPAAWFKSVSLSPAIKRALATVAM